MRFRKFIINNYRAIEKTVVNLNHNLVPVIGINESGKTTVLQAILCFDSNKDSFNEGDHHHHKNKYVLEDKKTCSIQAEVLLENINEVNTIANEVGMNQGSQELLDLTSKFENKTPILVTRFLPSLTYKIENIAIADEHNERLAKSIVQQLPNIKYFKTFEDEIPESITFGSTYPTPQWNDNSKIKPWRDLLEEVFLRASKGKHVLKKFVTLADDDDDRDNILRVVNHQLNKEIMEEWEKLRKIGYALSDEDLGNLRLEIKFFKNADKTEKLYEFNFKVIDTTGDTSQ